MVNKTQVVELANEDIAFTLPVKLEKSFSIDKSTQQVPEIFGSIELKTGKYFWGYASVDVTDTEGDRITLRALDKVKDDLIVAPYNKIFLSHNYQDIAVGMIVATSVDSKGLLILAKLNEDHERANETWSSLQNGFLDAFSIGGKFVTMERIYNEDTEEFNNVATEIEAMEVSLTSIPANPSAMLMGAFEKARHFIKLLNGKETLLNEDKFVIPEKMIEDKEEIIETPTETVEETTPEVIETKDDVIEEVKEEVIETPEEVKTEEIIEEKKDNDSVEENTDTKIPETKEEVEEPKIEKKEIEEDKKEEKEEEKESDDLIDAKKTIETLTKDKKDLEVKVEELEAEVKGLKSKDEKGDDKTTDVENKEEVKEETKISSVNTKEDKELEKTSEPLRKSIVLNNDTLISKKDNSGSSFMKWLKE